VEETAAVTIEKRVLVAARVRRPPREGFSWLDRRFVREHAPRLSGEAIALYFFLAAVSDRDGLSYWKDTSIAARLRLAVEEVVRARCELVLRDLVAHEEPLTQVLSLPPSAPARPPPRPSHGHGPVHVGDILRRIIDGGRRANESESEPEPGRGDGE
jgi:hypothetical protein